MPSSLCEPSKVESTIRSSQCAPRRRSRRLDAETIPSLGRSGSLSLSRALAPVLDGFG